MRKRHIPVSPTKQSGFQSIDEEDPELRTMDEEEGKPLIAAFETILPTLMTESHYRCCLGITPVGDDSRSQE